MKFIAMSVSVEPPKLGLIEVDVSYSLVKPSKDASQDAEVMSLETLTFADNRHNIKQLNGLRVSAAEVEAWLTSRGAKPGKIGTRANIWSTEWTQRCPPSDESGLKRAQNRSRWAQRAAGNIWGAHPSRALAGPWRVQRIKNPTGLAMGLVGLAHAIYFSAGGGLSPEVLTFSESVTVVEPPGVVTVDSFFTSAFLSQPTENTVARLNSMQNVMIRFIAGTP
jgi:hypothetical protein